MGDWSTPEKILALGALSGLYRDIEATKADLRNGGKELNPLLGEKPSDAKLNIAGMLTALGGLLAADALPDKYRAGMLGGWAGLEHALAAKNRRTDHERDFLKSVKKPLAAGILSGVLSHLMLSQDEDASVMIEPQKKGATITYRRKF